MEGNDEIDSEIFNFLNMLEKILSYRKCELKFETIVKMKKHRISKKIKGRPQNKMFDVKQKDETILEIKITTFTHTPTSQKRH
ncbi:hypothetical protein ACF0H5_001522 [Mactra antiquata]